MKRIDILLGAIVLISSSGAAASNFEFCDFEGDITSVEVNPEGSYELTVFVAVASRAKDLGEESYTDCLEYQGKSIDADFSDAEISGRPEAGDRIFFSRSVVDGVDGGNYAGTSIRTRFLQLRKQSTARRGF